MQQAFYGGAALALVLADQLPRLTLASGGFHAKLPQNHGPHGQPVPSVVCHVDAGLESIYVWKGEVNRDEELLLMIKSRQALMTELTAHVKGLHPYDECEVISVPITGGSESYLKWVMDSTKDA